MVFKAVGTAPALAFAMSTAAEALDCTTCTILFSEIDAATTAFEAEICTVFIAALAELRLCRASAILSASTETAF